MLGKQIGQYRIEQVVAQREVSSLYLAYDVNQNCLTFVEILASTVDQDPQLADRFRQRMEQVAQLNHPGIVAISDIGLTATNRPYVATRYVSGEPLSEKLTRRLPEKTSLATIQALQLVRQIANALAVAHRAGLVHHNLRPENIIVGEDSKPVLMGWGVPDGSASTAFTGEKANVGSLDYASPEQLQGKGVNGRSDIYSLGIILYELLTGHRPQLPISDWDVSVTPETYHLVQNCLWPEERNRFEDMDKVVAAIKAAIWAERLQNVTAVLPIINRRWLYGVVGLSIPILLLLGFVLFRGYGGTRAQSDTGQSEMAVPDQNADPSNGAVRTNLAIELVNPPPGSAFVPSNTIAFDWSYPNPLEPDQQFAVYARSANELYRIGTVTEPVIVSLYRLQVKGSDINGVGDNIEWQVILETATSGESLAQSNWRSVIVLHESPTPEPSPLPGTALTASATATGTASATSTTTTTATPTPSCQPTPPPNWVTYTVKVGDALFPLATQTGTLVAELQRVNCLEDTILSVGQVLWLPALPATETPVATDTPLATPTLVSQPEPPPDPGAPQPNPSEPPPEPPPATDPAPPRPTNEP